jgi:hypothetical protein
MQLGDTLKLEKFDHGNFGFLRLEVTKTPIVGSCFSAPYSETVRPTRASVSPRYLGITD